MNQIIVCPNKQIGAVTVNYVVEFYRVEYVLVGGIRAANGWHVAPVEKRKTAKTPFMAAVVAASALESYLAFMAHKDDIVERW